MIVSPESAEALYAFLLTTKPFSRWKLPDPHDVHFEIMAKADTFADYTAPKHRIRISAALCTWTDTYLKTMIHEVCHLKQEIEGRPLEHDSYFIELVNQACKVHKMDPSTI